jgi:hypothetical protein
VSTACYAVFAGYAALVAVFSGPGQDRGWAVWAGAGYTAAVLLSRRRGAGRAAALAASAAGAVAGPLIWLAWRAPPTPDVRVVARSAVLLLQHGTPYLPAGHLASRIAYDPYLPGMTVFGLPGAFDLDGVAGDPRIWLCAVTGLLLVLALRVAGRPDAVYWGVFAVASPVLAFPLAVGVTDPPVLALICLTLALLGRAPGRRPAHWPGAGGPAGGGPAGGGPVFGGPVFGGPVFGGPVFGGPVCAAAVTLGVACAMKATAWPALPVLAAMLAVRDGARTAIYFATRAAAAALGLTVLLAPGAAASPAALVQNTMLFPLGLTAVRTPAASPLPGHLLATLGPAGRLAAVSLLLAAGLAVATALLIRPPADPPAAARRLAIALALLFTLSPATRFGYFSYPIGLLGWLAIGRAGLPGPAPPAAAARAGPVSVPAGPLA